MTQTERLLRKVGLGRVADLVEASRLARETERDLREKRSILTDSLTYLQAQADNLHHTNEQVLGRTRWD